MCRAPSAATAARLAARARASSSSWSPSPSLSAGNSSALHSRVSSRASTASAATASSNSCESCEGYVRMKKRSALTWSTRFAVLRGAELYVFYSKQDAGLRRNLVDSLTVASGRIAPRSDLGLELLATDKREFQARMFSRGDFARWVTAFHRLAVRREAAEAAATSTVAIAKRARADTADSSEPTAARTQAHDQVPRSSASDQLDAQDVCLRASERSSACASEEQEQEEHNPVVIPTASARDVDRSEARLPNARRRVSFNGSVMVRLIPALEQEQVPELFYSRKEVERFSAQASSLLSRTEDAVSCACLALRRGPTTLLPWRRQVA